MAGMIALGAASVVLLTGCVGGGSAPRQDAEVLEQRLEAVEGVASATVEQDEYSSGPSAQRTSIVHVALADGYRVGDATAAFEWLARAAWAVDDAGPTTSNLMFGFTDAAGAPVDWDWSAGAVALGLDPDDVDSLIADQGLVDVVASNVPSAWGDAPGPLPDAPPGAIVAD